MRFGFLPHCNIFFEARDAAWSSRHMPTTGPRWRKTNLALSLSLKLSSDSQNSPTFLSIGSNPRLIGHITHSRVEEVTDVACQTVLAYTARRTKKIPHTQIFIKASSANLNTWPQTNLSTTTKWIIKYKRGLFHVYIWAYSVCRSLRPLGHFGHPPGRLASARE